MTRPTIEQRLELYEFPICPKKMEKLRMHRARLRQLCLVEKRTEEDPEVKEELEAAQFVLALIACDENFQFLLLDPAEQEAMLDRLGKKGGKKDEQ